MSKSKVKQKNITLIRPDEKITYDNNQKKSEKSTPWDDWSTASTIWNFNVGKKAREGLHGLEDLDSIKYFADRRDIYKNATFPGTLVPQLVEKLIMKYSKKGDLIVDPFIGSGTTLIEAKKLNRRLIGIDINPGAIELINRKLNQITLDDFDSHNDQFRIIQGDALEELQKINDKVDLVIAHPPYWNLLQFTEDKKDLSGMKLEDFLKSMADIFKEINRILKEEKFCIVIIGDRRKRGIVPLGFYLAELGLREGFNLWDLLIYDTRYGGKQINIYRQLKSKKHHFHLQDHDFILIFQKTKMSWKHVKIEDLY